LSSLIKDNLKKGSFKKIYSTKQKLPKDVFQRQKTNILIRKPSSTLQENNLHNSHSKNTKEKHLAWVKEGTMIDLIVFLKKGMLKRSIDNRTMWLVNRYRLKELSVVRGFRRSSMRGLKDALVLNMQKLTRISYSRITMIHLFSHKQI
jgi:hypothetical protein